MVINTPYYCTKKLKVCDDPPWISSTSTVQRGPCDPPIMYQDISKIRPAGLLKSYLIVSYYVGCLNPPNLLIDEDLPNKNRGYQ